MIVLSHEGFRPREPRRPAAIPFLSTPLFHLHLFALSCKVQKITPLFSNSSALFKKSVFTNSFSINGFRTLLQNRGVAPSYFNLGSRLFSLLGTRHSPLATAAVNPVSANVDAASSISPLFATLTKNTGGGGGDPQHDRFSKLSSRGNRGICFFRSGPRITGHGPLPVFYSLKPLPHMAHPYTCTRKKGPAAREPRYSQCAAC